MSNNKDIKHAIILGSGLDSLVDGFSEKTLIEEDKTGIHKKKIYIARNNAFNILIFSGRKHYYEGYGMDDILLNVRKANEFGIKNLLITNAAGALNPNFRETDIMLIKSSINFTKMMVPGKNGVLQDKQMRSIFINSCRDLKLKCCEGIYGFLTGPAYETRSEIRMFRKFNIDAVGMSTVPELSEASALGIRTLAVSVITNILNENKLVPPNHDHVLLTARKASSRLIPVIMRFFNELN